MKNSGLIIILFVIVTITLILILKRTSEKYLRIYHNPPLDPENPENPVNFVDLPDNPNLSDLPDDLLIYLMKNKNGYIIPRELIEMYKLGNIYKNVANKLSKQILGVNVPDLKDIFVLVVFTVRHLMLTERLFNILGVPNTSKISFATKRKGELFNVYKIGDNFRDYSNIFIDFNTNILNSFYNQIFAIDVFVKNIPSNQEVIQKLTEFTSEVGIDALKLFPDISTIKFKFYFNVGIVPAKKLINESLKKEKADEKEMKEEEEEKEMKEEEEEKEMKEEEDEKEMRELAVNYLIEEIIKKDQRYLQGVLNQINDKILKRQLREVVGYLKSDNYQKFRDIFTDEARSIIRRNTKIFNKEVLYYLIKEIGRPEP